MNKYTQDEVKEILLVSASTITRLKGELKPHAWGQKLLYPEAELLAHINSLPETKRNRALKQKHVVDISRQSVDFEMWAPVKEVLSFYPFKRQRLSVVKRAFETSQYNGHLIYRKKDVKNWLLKPGRLTRIYSQRLHETLGFDTFEDWLAAVKQW